MTRTSRIFPLAAAVSLAAALAGCKGEPAAGGPPGMGGPRGPVEVAVGTVAPRAVELTTELPGRTAATRVAEVRPQVSGIVRQRLFAEGADVKAGQPLYRIDPATYQAQLASAEADLARAEANAGAARAKAARLRSLSGSNVVSKQDLDDAVAAQRQTEALVAAAKAALELARINLERTTVVAPIAGRIGKSAVSEGALVTANQAQALTVIQQLDPIYVDLNQSAEQVMALRRQGGGERAPITVLLGNGASYGQPGEITFSDVSVDTGTGTVQLRAVVPNPKGELLPGLFVRARVGQGTLENAVLVPQQAVSRLPNGGAQVLVVGEDGKVAPRPVKAERAIGSDWLVTEGLAAGDRYVVEGFQKVRPGAEVKAVPVGQQAAPGKPAEGKPPGGPAAAQAR